MAIGNIDGTNGVVLNDPVSGQNNVQSSANADAQPGVNLAESAVGLFNLGTGKFDRLQGYFGSLPERNPVLEGLVSQLLVTQRAALMLLMTMVSQNDPNWTFRNVDDFNVEDVTKRAALLQGRASDPNTLQ